MSKEFLVLAVNPGATSTKVAVFQNETLVKQKDVRHTTSEFKDCKRILDQKEIRLAYIMDFLREAGIRPESLNGIVGRGGLIKPIESGTYLINDNMIQDLLADSAAVHASALGGLMAAEIGMKYNLPAYVVDPVVVDEMEPCAKFTGFPGIERRSVFHALNSKAVARRCAKDIGIAYEDGRFVVAHMGGGITVAAHRYGRVIDVSNAIDGEGPFTPERCGAVTLEPLVERCFDGRTKKSDIMAMINKSGGLMAYLDTNDLREVEKMIREGDEYAALVLDAMAYQVAKEIGAMVAVLEGRLNAVVLSGGIAHSTRFTGSIKQRIDQIAQVVTYPGEDEMKALAEGVLRVLRGEDQAKIYT